MFPSPGQQSFAKATTEITTSKSIRLLALDGGGVRGLSTLIILRQLMETINPDSPPKPCDYFDMVGGTSTGGLIAVMLGRLKMSIEDCIAAYLSLSDKIFHQRRHRVTLKGKIQGRFDSEELERAVKMIVKQQGLDEDVLLKDAGDASCKVTPAWNDNTSNGQAAYLSLVSSSSLLYPSLPHLFSVLCATSKETSETVCLTSYRSPRGNNDLLNSVKIWEACRATSAASSFFEPITIGLYREEFVDGATGANNPVMELWNEAQTVFGPDPLERNLKCLVSIGTGIPSLRPFPDDMLHIGKALVAIATDTEQTAERFRRDKAHLDSSGRYFRFNVIRGLEDIGLEESAKAKEIAAATRRYVTSQEIFNQMQSCATNLRIEKALETMNDPMAALLAALPSAGNTPFRQELVDAAKDGDAALVSQYLQLGADVNSKADLDRLPAFWHAVHRGHPEVAKVLIDSGKLKIDQKDGYGVTAFYWAVSGGHDEIVDMMLATNQVNVNIRDKQRQTPLMIAARNGNDHVVKMILETGKADVTAKSTIRTQQTALDAASRMGHSEVVDLLRAYSSS